MKTLLIFMVFGCNMVLAQSTDTLQKPKNNLHLLLSGSGYFTYDYERLFYTKTALTYSGTAGFGFYPYDLKVYGETTKTKKIIPVNFSFLYGNPFSLETGIGITFGLDDGIDAFDNHGPIKWFDGILGFRYQNPTRGFIFRIGYTPWIYFRESNNNADATTKIESTSYFSFSLGSAL